MQHFTDQEVLNALKKLSRGKAIGIDLLPDMILHDIEKEFLINKVGNSDHWLTNRLNDFLN